MMSTNGMFLFGIFLVLLQACASNSAAPQKVVDQPLLASIADFYSPRFKSGSPAGGEALEDTLAESASVQLEYLQETAAILISNATARVSVVGHTDNSECQQLACEDLSLRRARLVRNWLVRVGVKDSQLEAASSSGSRVPLDFNTTEEGRANNRRVEITLL